MAAQAPICHIPPVQLAVDPHPVALPSIPIATPEIASLVASVNALRQVVQYLSGQKLVLPPPVGRQNTGGPNRVPDPSNASRWNEISRVTDTVRVFQNGDKNSDNWVDVKQINKLVMKDSVTGEKWTWNR